MSTPVSARLDRVGDAVRRPAVRAEKKPKMPAVPLPPNELPVPTAPNVPRAPVVPVPEPAPEELPPREERAAARYNDEAIARDNYFRTAGDDDEKTASAVQAEAGAAAPDDAVDLAARPRGTLTYYYEVKEKLDAAFAANPRDGALLQAFPHSEWVRTEGARLGIIYANGVPRYLCVAAEGEFPPDAMKEHAVFVPKDAFSQSEGFWVVFQDADTGEVVGVRIEEETVEEHFDGFFRRRFTRAHHAFHLSCRCPGPDAALHSFGLS